MAGGLSAQEKAAISGRIKEVLGNDFRELMTIARDQKLAKPNNVVNGIISVFAGNQFFNWDKLLDPENPDSRNLVFNMLAAAIEDMAPHAEQEKSKRPFIG